MSGIDPLFLTYLSLVRCRTARLFPDLSAFWQLAPDAIREALPFRDVLLMWQQRVRELETDAGCLLSDPHFGAVVHFLIHPPLLPWVDKLGNRVEANPDVPDNSPCPRLQIAAQPADWLLAKLKIPLKLHSFDRRILTQQDKAGDCFTAYRSGFTFTLGELEVQVRVDICHGYRNITLQQQQEDIARQFAAALPGMERQLIEEASCLCCYGLQIFLLTHQFQVLLDRFEAYYRDKDLPEV